MRKKFILEALIIVLCFVLHASKAIAQIKSINAYLLIYEVDHSIDGKTLYPFSIYKIQSDSPTNKDFTFIITNDTDKKFLIWRKAEHLGTCLQFGNLAYLDHGRVFKQKINDSIDKLYTDIKPLSEFIDSLPDSMRNKFRINESLSCIFVKIVVDVFECRQTKSYRGEAVDTSLFLLTKLYYVSAMSSYETKQLKKASKSLLKSKYRKAYFSF